MNYTCTIQINLPVSKVVELWENEDNFKHWQDGFVKIEHLSGEKGKVGSTARIFLDDGKRKMELVETVLIDNLPTEKKAEYVHVHMTNTQSSRFNSINENTTEYTSEVVYTTFNGFMPKLMSKLFPGMFKKQSEKWMKQFKEFAEKQAL